MALFRVLLRGENFPAAILGEKGSIGFYTTRFVEAVSAADAETAALEVLRADTTLTVPEEYQTEDATVFADEIVEVPEGTPRVPNAGFAFFPMKENIEGGPAT